MKRIDRRENSAINPESVKIAFEEWFNELNIDYFYETKVYDALVENSSLKGVHLATPEGPVLLKAPLFIDATGDGALAAAAGVPYTVGRESDNLCQGASLSFQIGGIDKSIDIAALPQSFGQPYMTPSGELNELAKAHLTPPAGHVLLHKTAEEGVAMANMTNAVKFDCTSAKERTQAISLCRRQMREIVDFLKQYVPGFENCYLHSSASQFGIRESRHFHGLYTLNEKDIVCGRVFDDWISTNNYFCFDVHSVTGSGLDESGSLDGGIIRPYTIPRSACIPTGIGNLLLCGRNISATSLAHSSFRVMPICMNIGHGVGVVAANALEENCAPIETNIGKIHNELIKQGVIPQ